MIPRAVLALLLAVAPACRTYDPQVFDERLRAATFDAYWSELDENYPYFGLMHVDWNSARERFRDEALAAPTRLEFAKVLARMLDELEDPHVTLASPVLRKLSERSIVPCALAVVDRKLYVEWLPDVVGVDSTRTDDHVPAEIPRLLAIDGNGVRRVDHALLLLSGEAGTTSRLSLAWRTKPEQEVSVRRPEKMSWSGSVASPAGVANAGDVGYLRLRTLDTGAAKGGRDEFLAYLDSAIDRLSRTRALVLDLQYNQGGDLELLLGVLGRFFREPVFAARGRVFRFGPFLSEGDIEVEPRQDAYAGRIVVLVNAETASAAEWMASILRRERGAVLIGERTAGAVAAVHERKGPDGSVLSYGRWPLTGAGGEDFQGVGIEPDVGIPLTLDSVEQHGYWSAQFMVREERLRRALEILGAEDRFEGLREEAGSGGGSLWQNGRGDSP